MQRTEFIPRKAVEAAWVPFYKDLNYKKPGRFAVLDTSQDIIEKSLSTNEYFPTVLEVGAGTGAHFSSVRHRFDRYIASDLSDHFLEMLTRRFGDEPKVDVQKVDATRMPFEDQSIDRIIATHVLEHLNNPVDVLAEWDRCLRPGGVISVILPCDPGILYRLGRSFGPRRNAEKVGMPYDYVMAREHVNSIYNLQNIIKFHYPDAEEFWWPLSFIPNPDINAIYGAHMRKRP